MEHFTGLILEGGGMRGAYTAGCLTWLLDQNIQFDAHYGISTGAVNLCAYLMGSKDHLFNFFTDYILDPKGIGIRPLLREGVFVSYDYLFEEHMVKNGFRMEDLKDYKGNAKIGIYGLSQGKTDFYSVTKMNIEMLKAACSLPILGKPVVLNGKKYLDGGITKMLAIEEALHDGVNRSLIIATKPLDYVRKPANWFVKWLMRVLFRDSPQLGKDYAVRHLNYQKQVAIIKDLEKEGKALYLCPSQKTKVTRIHGSKEELVELFRLGIQDMECRKEEIYQFLGVQK